MSIWTLTYQGVTQTLAAWGIQPDVTAQFANKERDVVTLTTAEPFDPAAAQFAWGLPVTIQRDGAVWFAGFVGEVRMQGSGNHEAIGYELYGPWWLLERLQFKQTRQMYAGWITAGHPESGAKFDTVFVAESFLGEDPAENFWTGTQTLTEVLNWANECYNATKRGASTGRNNAYDLFQVGTIDCGQVFPKTRAQTVSCADAIVQILRYFPTAVTWFDYANPGPNGTNTPPTLYIRDLANLTGASVTLTASQESAVEIAPQYARQLAGVILCYKKNQIFNGQSYPQLFFDKYPTTITDYTPDVLTHVAELTGSKLTQVQGTPVVIPIAPAYSSTAADRVAFWTNLDATLQDPLIKAASIQIAAPSSVVAVNGGAVVDVTVYPNILAPGCEVFSWMGVNWIEATISVAVTFSRYRDTSFNTLDATLTRTLKHRVILTNATNKTYTANSSIESGDPVPPIYPDSGSLAYALYQSLSRLQYQGSVKFKAGEARNDLAMGQVLTLVGPSHTYAGLLVQGVTVRPHFGEVTVKFGPASRLDAPALIELWLCTRWRTTYNMPSGRGSGVASADASLDETGTAHKENTTHGVPRYASMAIGPSS